MVSDQGNPHRTCLLDAHWHHKILNAVSSVVRNYFLTVYGHYVPHSRGKTLEVEGRLISQIYQEVRRGNISKSESLFECWTSKKIIYIFFFLWKQVKQWEPPSTVWICIKGWRPNISVFLSFRKWAVPNDQRDLKYQLVWCFRLKLNSERVIKTKVFPEIVHFICFL